MQQTLDLLRLLAAKVCAKAALELFPETRLISARATVHGFSVECIFPCAFDAACLPLLEERMGQVLRTKRARLVEMVPASASAYFAHQGQDFIAQRIGALSAPLVTLVEVETLLDEWSETSLPPPNFLKAFRLLEFSQKLTCEGRAVTQIVGTAFPTKEELKEFLKKRETFGQKDHLVLGKELDLFLPYENGFLWRPRGETLRQLFLAFWKEELVKEKFQFVCQQGINAPQEMLPERSAEYLWKGAALSPWERGLLTPKQGLFDRVHIFCAPEELLQNAISSLQLVIRILKICDFKFGFALFSSKEGGILEEALQALNVPYQMERSAQSKVSFQIQDGMGRTWEGPFVEESKKGLALSLFNPLERLIALVLENGQGKLPLGFAPEQVRIIAVKEAHYAEEVGQRLKEAGLRVHVDVRPVKVAEKLHDGLKWKIPFVVFVGEQEEKKKCITVRALAAEKAEEMSVENFIEKLKLEN